MTSSLLPFRGEQGSQNLDCCDAARLAARAAFGYRSCAVTGPFEVRSSYLGPQPKSCSQFRRKSLAGAAERPLACKIRTRIEFLLRPTNYRDTGRLMARELRGYGCGVLNAQGVPLAFKLGFRQVVRSNLYSRAEFRGQTPKMEPERDIPSLVKTLILG